MSNKNNDIDTLLARLHEGADFGYDSAMDNLDKCAEFHRALTALVAERDALWKERDELLKENVALRDRLKAKQDEVLDREYEMDALRKNTTELESELTAAAQRVSNLIAERDSLRDEIAAAYRDRASSKSVFDRVKAERDALQQRVAELVQFHAELEAQQPADSDRGRDRELRERLVESALRGAGTGAARSVRSSMLTEAEAEALGRQAVWMAEGAFDEMRKGGGA